MPDPVKNKLLNEVELLLRIANGDEQAFTVLYSFYQPRLLRYVFPFALSRPFAEEIVQEVLFKLWIRRETLVGILSLEKYLQRMAKNKLLDHLKKQTTEQQHIHRLSVVKSITAYADDDLLFKEYHQIAWDAINKLPEKQKEVFLLRHRGDMTLDEIASATGSTKAAVQKNLTRAVHFIKDQLRSHGVLTFSAICFIFSLQYIIRTAIS